MSDHELVLIGTTKTTKAWIDSPGGGQVAVFTELPMHLWRFRYHCSCGTAGAAKATAREARDGHAAHVEREVGS